MHRVGTNRVRQRHDAAPQPVTRRSPLHRRPKPPQSHPPLLHRLPNRRRPHRRRQPIAPRQARKLCQRQPDLCHVVQRAAAVEHALLVEPPGPLPDSLGVDLERVEDHAEGPEGAVGGLVLGQEVGREGEVDLAAALCQGGGEEPLALGAREGDAARRERSLVERLLLESWRDGLLGVVREHGCSWLRWELVRLEQVGKGWSAGCGEKAGGGGAGAAKCPGGELEERHGG